VGECRENHTGESGREVDVVKEWRTNRSARALPASGETRYRNYRDFANLRDPTFAPWREFHGIRGMFKGARSMQFSMPSSFVGDDDGIRKARRHGPTRCPTA